MSQNKPVVLFVCVHNAGRSQMAAGFMKSLSNGQVEVLSAGSQPKESINPVAIEVMSEVGIDISNNVPKVLTTEAVKESDVVITMGCGDSCPVFPGKRYEDWVLEDPAGKDLIIVRKIRDEIKIKVSNLLSEIL
jgi:protein-tyrosine-phosphatase